MVRTKSISGLSLLICCAGGLAFACAFNTDQRPIIDHERPMGTGAGPSTGGMAGFAGKGSDSRPPVTSDVVPPPISGGTLHVTPDGKTALVADPDRDRISIVDISTRTVEKTLFLTPGDQPTRITQAGDVAYIVLRGSGSVVSVDLKQQTLGARRLVCTTPRGAAFNDKTSKLLVVCADGNVIELPPEGTTPRRNARIDGDLRDVVVRDGKIFVTRFRSAEILELGAELNVVRRTRPASRSGVIREFDSASTTFAPSVAWRTIPTSTGLVMAHQSAAATVIDVDPDVPGQSPYGSRDTCGGVVHSTVTVVSSSGAPQTFPQIADVILPTDVAVSRDGLTIAVASAGQMDPQQPFAGGALTEGPAVSVITASGATSGENCLRPPKFGNTAVTSVAFAADGTLLSYSREPARLFITTISGVQPTTTQSIDLGGASRLDTGHEMFHRNAGANVACASCHPEAGDDGQVWNFSDSGPRRTQFLSVGLSGTAPFHWNGDLPEFKDLMARIFVGRMGGLTQSPERMEVMKNWLFSQEAPPPMRAAADPAAVRGKTLFDSREVGCTQCHTGAKFTSKDNQDVGTGGEFQVPSLFGVAYHAPYMHTGCAPTLLDRFDPSCGGDAHGNTEQLNSEQLQDLIAYLESL